MLNYIVKQEQMHLFLAGSVVYVKDLLNSTFHFFYRCALLVLRLCWVELYEVVEYYRFWIKDFEVDEARCN